MKRLSTKLTLWSGLALCGAATSAYSLTILPVFDSSIQNDPNSAAMIAAIKAGIAVVQSAVADNVTVKIKFVNDPKVGLGQSSTSASDYAYVDFLAALKRKVTSPADNRAVALLLNTLTEPVRGGTQISLSSPLARGLGVDATLPDDVDATISLKMSAMNFTRPPADPDKYDLQATVEHEIDEVLGFASSLPNGANIAPIDLFRYDSTGRRTYTTNGDDAYFSLDGKTLLARFNQDSQGDYSDWWSANGNLWSPPGSTPAPQVQDAFGSPGNFQDLGPRETLALDVIGWTLAATRSTIPGPAELSMATGGNGELIISWGESTQSFVLQTSSDLRSGAWADAPSGMNNPAVIQATQVQQFYRLRSADSTGGSAAPKPSAKPHSPYYLKIHVIQPRPSRALSR